MSGPIMLLNGVNPYVLIAYMFPLLFVAEKTYVGRYIAYALPQAVTAISITEVEIPILGPVSGGKVIIPKVKYNLFISFSSLILRYSALIDLWCTDYRRSAVHQCHELNYRFRSLIHLGCDLVYSLRPAPQNLLTIASISKIFLSAGWLEREISDLYGIFSIGNCDMRRISTDYGFNGYPFRRDFPLFGYLELRYDDEYVEPVREPIQPPQNFRFGRDSSTTTVWDLSILYRLVGGA